MARAETAETEVVFALHPTVHPAGGMPMPALQQYRLPKRMADIRYQRGLARPAAEVYLERLRDMGVAGIIISKDAEPSVRSAAAKVGVGCTADTPGGRRAKS